jgi:hypothetical protein
MKFKKVLPLFSALVILSSMIGVLPAGAASPQAGDSFTRQISSAIVTSFPASNSGPDVNGVQMPEIPDEIREAEGAAALVNGASQNSANQPLFGRSESQEHHDRNSDHHGHGPLTSPNVNSSSVANSNPGLFRSFNGLNHRDQRLANGGNQFSIEPPDQGLCVGNGYVLESVNDVLRVYDTSGNPLTGVIDLNSFYGYAAQINRTTGEQGAFVTDPSCYYDPDTQHWFQVVLTLDVDPGTGDFLGSNHIDIAVSTSADPTGSWVVYRLPVQDDGTDGTPNHGCSFGPCIGDYPHIGADKYGFYVTTNEYSLFGPEFTSAQIYAFSKSALAANAPVVTVVQFDTTDAVHSSRGHQPGFTVWPAISPASKYYTQSNGVEFFMSSNAGEEANEIPGGGFSNEIVVWSLSNTKSLNSAHPNLTLDNKVVRSEVYGIPPKSDQKAGDIPLGECLNDTSDLFGTDPDFGNLGCWFLFLDPPITWQPEVESHLDSNDTRIQQVWYADGKLWTALDTIVTVGHEDRAGIAYFVVNPDIHNNHLDANIEKQGYVAVAHNNVTYPAIAVLPNGKGIMAFTLVGQNYYPSAAYVSIDKKGTGSVHVAAAGLGPDDGFTSYKAFVGDPPRTRWGDYGAAVTDGNKIWFASEYIAQTCTLDTYLSGSIGSCGGTRTSLANWATRISGVAP